MNLFCTLRSVAVSTFATLALLTSITSPQARVLDNFDDNTVTAWSKFDFNTGAGQLSEANGQFTIAVPQVGQLFFAAATKTTETFTIQDGRTIEFRVDLVNANQEDAFAILSWIPTTESVGNLAGYSLAKDMTDVLVTKGLNKYFLNEATPLKNENVTMVLSLTGQGTSVIINAKILDKDNGNAVIFDRTYTDTIAADTLDEGTDSPAASYTGQSGNFVLLLYHNDTGGSLPGSSVTFDNAEVFVSDSVILDDFNDNTLTSWSKFDFNTGAGQLTEAGGTFTIATPPVGQLFFVAATKTSQAFSITDGSTVEFSVDLLGANQDNAFAILSWIPTTEAVGNLAGYSIAKDPTDILVTKGLNKYFINEATTLKNDNVTLKLSLTGQGTSVIIHARVLDKDADNAVLFERTFTDTINADTLDEGTDSPAASYIGKSGNFVLLLYHNDTGGNLPGSSVQFDNATVKVFGEVPANSDPVIADIMPANGAIFQPANTEIHFTVNDDKPLSTNNISVNLNGTVYTGANGLSFMGTATSRMVMLGNLQANQNYEAVLTVTDSDGVTRSSTLNFDTFASSNIVIESEDYNFSSGQFLDNNVLIGENAPAQPTSYKDSVGTRTIDFADARPNPGALADFRYRIGDPVGTQRASDFVRQKFVDAGGAAAEIFDYSVRDLSAGDWMNYTRTIPAGTYHIYLRQSVFNIENSVATLSRVTSGATTDTQTTVALGTFTASRSGVEYRNVPLADALGNPVPVTLSGVQTLRVTQVTEDPDDNYIFQNYLVLVPTTASGTLRPLISELSPLPDSTANTTRPEVRAVILDRDTTVNTGSIQLQVNGSTVTHGLVNAGTSHTVTYAFTSLPASGATNTARLVFADSQGVSQTNRWSFVIEYKSLAGGNARPVGSGTNPGFSVRLVQAPAGSNLANSLERAKLQLAAGSSIPAAVDTNTTAAVINYTQNFTPSADGYFEDAETFPGIDPAGNTDDFAVEATAYLELAAGAYTFGVRSDDGFELTSGTSLTDTSGLLLGVSSGGTFDGTFEFVAPQAGLYPFRLIYYERGGGANVELFSVNRSTDEKVLINDLANANAIKAFRNAGTAASLVLVSSATVDGTFSVVAGANIDTNTETITVPLDGAMRFYQVRRTGGTETSLEITQIQVVGGNVVIRYDITP